MGIASLIILKTHANAMVLTIGGKVRIFFKGGIREAHLALALMRALAHFFASFASARAALLLVVVAPVARLLAIGIHLLTRHAIWVAVGHGVRAALAVDHGAARFFSGHAHAQDRRIEATSSGIRNKFFNGNIRNKFFGHHVGVGVGVGVGADTAAVCSFYSLRLRRLLLQICRRRSLRRIIVRCLTCGNWLHCGLQQFSWKFAFLSGV